MKRALCSIGAGLIVCGLAWVAGFDFTERGYTAFCVAVASLWAVFLVCTYPGWGDE